MLLFYIIYMENSEFLRKVPSILPRWTQQKNAMAETLVPELTETEGRRVQWGKWAHSGCRSGEKGDESVGVGVAA